MKKEKHQDLMYDPLDGMLQEIASDFDAYNGFVDWPTTMDDPSAPMSLTFILEDLVRQYELLYPSIAPLPGRSDGLRTSGRSLSFLPSAFVFHKETEDIH